MHKKSELLTKGAWEDGVLWEFYFGENLTNLPLVSVCGLYIKNERILLTRNSRGWDITGGHIEKDETPIETLYREMLEEGGVKVSDHRHIGYYVLTYTQNTINKSTGLPYPDNAIIPCFLVNTKKPIQALTAKECSDAKMFYIYGPEVQNLREKGLFNGIYKYAKEKNLLFS